MPTKDISVIAARRIATEAHEGQTDRGGTPYINHAVAVADMALDIAWSELTPLVASDRIFVVIEALGLLHDVIEDASTNAQRVDRMRRITIQCGKDIADGVTALTRDPLESYVDYIRQVAGAPYAVRVVKRADNRHNSDLTRVAKPVVRCARCKTHHDDVGSRCRCAPVNTETALVNTPADRVRADKYAVTELLLERCGTV
ncbi:MAG: hypothetical protein ABW167_13245 [Baekduia sp.]